MVSVRLLYALVLLALPMPNMPTGVIHTFWNAAGQGPQRPALVVNCTLSPGSVATEAFFENLAGVSNLYGGMDRINPLQMLLLFVHYKVHGCVRVCVAACRPDYGC